MTEQDKPFRFLSNEEFAAVPGAKKAIYLLIASLKLEERRRKLCEQIEQFIPNATVQDLIAMEKGEAKPLMLERAQYEYLGTQLLGYEVAISSFFEILARTNPATAQALAQALRENSRHLDDRKYPGLRKKIEVYVRVLESSGRVSH